MRQRYGKQGERQNLKPADLFFPHIMAMPFAQEQNKTHEKETRSCRIKSRF